MFELTEAQFAKQVIKLATLYDWHIYRTWLSIRSPSGYPDLTLVRERVIWAELKSDKGKVTPAQEQWIEWLRGAGAEVYVWKPSAMDDILEVLR